MVSPVTFNLENEVIKYLMTGARCDVAYRNESYIKTYFNIDGTELEQVRIKLFYQNNGTLIKEWVVDVAAASPALPDGTFYWEIKLGDLPAELKALNYWWEAYDDVTKEFLTYGTFSLNIG